jgi:hypothetical protein
MAIIKTSMKKIKDKISNKLMHLLYKFDLEPQKTWVGIAYKKVQDTDGKWREVEIGRNKVLLSGLMILAKYLYGKDFKVKTPTFEDKLFEDTSRTIKEDLRPRLTAVPNAQRYCGCFNIAYDGAQGSAVISEQRHKTGIDLDYLIPFRRIPLDQNDFSVYLQTYAHYRIIDVDGVWYVDYYSKKCDIDYTATLDDGTIIPDNPETSLTTDKDSRIIAKFTLNLTKDELVEWFRHEKTGGAESSFYNSIILMNGVPATIEEDGHTYNVFKDTYVFAKCNHTAVAHGADGVITVIYKLMHI